MRQGLLSTRFQADLSREFPGVDLARLRTVLAVFFWQWYRDNKNDTILKHRVFIFRVTVKVHHLHAVFVALFGLDPLPRVGDDSAADGWIR